MINRRTAPRLVPGGHSFPWKDSAVRPRALREDRILHEIHATGGDVRRICDLFGLSVEGATRYLATIEHPDLATEGWTGLPVLNTVLGSIRRKRSAVAQTSRLG